jgi:hypothetical protein
MEDLTKWFTKAAASGRPFLTVPEKFTELLCGCSRSATSKPFQIMKCVGGWTHYNPSCAVVLVMPEVNVTYQHSERTRRRMRDQQRKTHKESRGNCFF